MSNITNHTVKYGFLRETSELAQKSGRDRETGIHRTGLDEYLRIIFPDVDDWMHDKAIGFINGAYCRKRPDYRSESLKLIVEFDGLQHYTSPSNILRDKENTSFYSELGYHVIRIPYFIQLTNKVVEQLFDVVVDEPLFPEGIPSLGPKGKNTPAFLCIKGIQRMAEEFLRFPEQYLTNLEYLKSLEEQYLIDYEILESTYNELLNAKIHNESTALALQ